MIKKILYFVVGMMLVTQSVLAACGGCDSMILLTPNGGEVWNEGEHHDILWDITGSPCRNDYVDIYYSTDSGVSYPYIIALSENDDGIYDWLIPSGINSNQVRIKLIGVCSSSGDTEDTSDADFSIAGSVASNISDTLSDSTIGQDSKHSIKYDVSSAEIVTNGSIKINFDNNFDLSTLTGADVLVVGGDVIWGGAVVDVLNKNIVIPFTGNLNQTDGQLLVDVGLNNWIKNPPNIGSYNVNLGVYVASNGTGPIHETMTAQVAIVEGVVVSASIPQTLSFIVSGVSAGQNVNGALTNIGTTGAIIDFGTMNGATTRVGAQDISVSTNATNGFYVNVSFNANFSDGLHDIDNWTGTNNTPSLWSAPPGGGIEGYFGYTTDDMDLGSVPYNRFISNKWASLLTVGKEVMYHDGPTDGISPNSGLVRVGYQLDITNFQASGSYSTVVTYLCIPSY